MSKTAAKQPDSPPREAPRPNRRAEMLDVAAQLFARHGYAETDTQLLADTLSVGKGTIYRCFKSKRDLFLAVVDQVMNRLREAIDAQIAGIDDPLERIAMAVHAYLTFFADHPECVELLMQERAHFKDRKKPTYFKHREANIEKWLALYRDLIAQGRVRDVPVTRITDTMSQLLYGTIFINYFTGQRRPPEAQARDILDVVFHGILTAEGRRLAALNDPLAKVGSPAREGTP